MSAGREPAVDAVTAASGAGAIGPREILRYLRRSSLSIFAGAALFTSAAVVYVLTTPPSFTATASVFVDPASTQLFAQDAARMGDPATIAARIDSQAEVIKSGRISREVIVSLDLASDPEFRPAGDGFAKTILGLLRLNGRRAAAAAPDAATVAPRPAEGEAEPGPLAVPKANRTMLLFAQDAFRKRLSVRRVGQSLVFEISFRSGDPDKTARIANGIAAAYVAENVQAKSAAAQRGGVWLEERIEDLRDKAFESLRNVEQFRSVGGANSVNEAQVQLAELESISRSFRRVYEMYLERYHETVQRISYPVADVRVVSEATAPLHWSHPRSLLIVTFAGLLGAGAGAAAPLARRSVDRSVRTRRALTEAVAVACLGTLGWERPAAPAGRRRWGLLPSWSNGRRNVGLQPEPGPLLRDLRSIKVSIDRALPEHARRCVGVTSAGAVEGKAMLAAKLAYFCAKTGERTLLVDGCSIDPTVSRTLGGAADIGLMQVIETPGLLGSAILPGPMAANLSILPLGRTVGGMTPGDLLSAANANLNISDLTRDFDTVLFDLPPLSCSSDARAIGPKLDGVVLVATFAESSLTEVATAVAGLRAEGIAVLGVVVDKLNIQEHPEWLE